MKEIKFRAWYKEDKVMSRRFTLENLQCGQGVLDDFNKMEIMQFTGLLDKNAKEIYEGDIIKHQDEGERFEVYWSDINVSFKIIPISDKDINQELEDITFCENSKEFEVIGNIYENKDLLKGV